ncbi:MAG: MmgE/PrpD family protein [Gemmatimonadota bacterium]|nr:MmgE/PrpD family protein [Gemmatimonadota bacterium]
MAKSDINGFIAHARYVEFPEAVRTQLDKNLLDLFAATIAGLATPAANIVADYAAIAFPGNEATIAGRGRIGSAQGAALANACAANALDVDDGFRRAKGHPGAVVIPAALAMAQAEDASGADFLAAVVVGYEVGMRAGTIWHDHPHRGPSYHGSGSWGSVGAAAACARLLELGPREVEHALAIAEYHAPLAPIMDCVRRPAMVKDGIHWGAFVGVIAAQLAARGFTGMPATPYADEYRASMQTLGADWWIERVYYKFHPCCRWAQPAIAGAVELRKKHDLAPGNIAAVRIETFEAAIHLGTRRPTNTEEAQYSLPFPVASALVHGRVGVPEIAGDGLKDEAVLALSDRIEMSVDPAIEARFPDEALARVTVTTTGGRKHVTGPLPAPGDPDSGITFDDLVSKAHRLIEGVAGRSHAEHLVEAVTGCADLRTVEPLAECLERFG